MPSKIPGYLKAYYIKHAEKIKARSRKWHADHREIANKRSRAWYRANKHLCKPNRARRTENQMRRQSKMKCVGCRKAILKVYERAAELRKWFDVHVDHIVPICRGGLHTADNLQIIYGFENRRKRQRIDYKPSVIFL